MFTPLVHKNTLAEDLKQATILLVIADSRYRFENGLGFESTDPGLALITTAMMAASAASRALEAK